VRLRDRLWLLVSQAVNTLFFAGDPDESLSARAWRQRDNGAGRMRARIDRWLGQGHCQRVYELQVQRARSRLP
jgi:hypothetical protein